MKRSFEFFTFRRFWFALEYDFLSDGKIENAFFSNTHSGSGISVIG